MAAAVEGTGVPEDEELCSQCGVTTAGEVVYTVQGLLVHEQCFRCADCARVLSLQTFLWAGNYLYCRTHYHARFARKCAVCEELALDAMLWLNGRFYHANCLECSRCHRSIWPGHYLDRSGGEPMCINCERPALACLFDKAPLVQADAEKLLQSVSTVGGFFLYVREAVAVTATGSGARSPVRRPTPYWIAFWCDEDRFYHWQVKQDSRQNYYLDVDVDASYAELDRLVHHYCEYEITPGHCLLLPVEFPEVAAAAPTAAPAANTGATLGADLAGALKVVVSPQVSTTPASPLPTPRQRAPSTLPSQAASATAASSAGEEAQAVTKSVSMPSNLGSAQAGTSKPIANVVPVLQAPPLRRVRSRAPGISDATIMGAGVADETVVALPVPGPASASAPAAAPAPALAPALVVVAAADKKSGKTKKGAKKKKKTDKVKKEDAVPSSPIVTVPLTGAPSPAPERKPSAGPAAAAVAVAPKPGASTGRQPSGSSQAPSSRQPSGSSQATSSRQPSGGSVKAAGVGGVPIPPAVGGGSGGSAEHKPDEFGRARTMSNTQVATTVSPPPLKEADNLVNLRTNALRGSGKERPRSSLTTSLSGSATLMRSAVDTDGERRGRALDDQPFMYRSASLPRARGPSAERGAVPSLGALATVVDQRPAATPVSTTTTTRTGSPAVTVTAPGGGVAVPAAEATKGTTRRRSLMQRRKRTDGAPAQDMRPAALPHAAAARPNLQAAPVVIGPITVVTSSGQVTGRLSMDSQRSHSDGGTASGGAAAAGGGSAQAPKREATWTHRLRLFFSGNRAASNNR